MAAHTSDHVGGIDLNNRTGLLCSGKGNAAHTCDLVEEIALNNNSGLLCSRGGLLFVGCLTSQQQASASQGRICSDNVTRCRTEVEAADPTFYLTQSQYTDTGPISPSADPLTPDAWQGSHWSASFEVTGMTRPVASAIRTPDLPLSRRTP